MPTISQQASRTSRQLFLHRWAHIHPPDTCREVPIAMDANLGESQWLEGLCKASEVSTQGHHSWTLPTRSRVWPLHPRYLSSPICSQVGHWQRDSPTILPWQVEKVAG